MTTLPPRPTGLVIGLAVLGVVISWALFVPATLEHGFIGGWVGSFTTWDFSTGLHIDLVATDLMLFAMVIMDRERLGTKTVALTMLMGVTLGVCAALGVYWVGLQRARAA